MLANTLVMGANLSLQFTSLPSAQGWTFRTTGPLESATYSVDGTKLIMNTLGTGDTSTGYQIAGIVDPSLPFTITMRARVLQTEVLDDFFPATTLLAYAATGTDVYGIGLNTSTISAPLFSGQTHPFDATRFHDYRVEGVPGVGVKAFVDNALIASGPPVPFSVLDSLGFGNPSSSEKGYAEITAFTFQQPVPELQTLLLMLTGGAALATVHRYRQHRVGFHRLASRSANTV